MFKPLKNCPFCGGRPTMRKKHLFIGYILFIAIVANHKAQNFHLKSKQSLHGIGEQKVNETY